MRLGAVATAVVLLSIVFAGCSAAETQGQSETPGSTTAPAPVVDANTGSIAGTVTTDEMEPIPNAEVGVIGIDAVVTTDAQGAFTFNDVAPGTYNVLANALGFEQRGKKVDV